MCKTKALETLLETEKDLLESEKASASASASASVSSAASSAAFSAAAIEFEFAHPSERALAKQLLKLPEVVLRLEKELYPSLLCDYLFDTSQRFNQFYEQCPVNTVGGLVGWWVCVWVGS
jgi:hypothetical protein